MSDTLLIQVRDSLGRTAQATFIIPIFAPSPAATPTFSPAAGTYTSSQSVTISCSTPSSTIYYTTDGSTPTTASAVFTSPVTVAVSETIKAIATAPNFTQSAVGSAVYTISSATFVPNITALPIASSSTGPNTTAYNALNVSAMVAGTKFNDPTTNVATWKMTSGTVPTSGGSFAPWYSQMGLAISQAWGSNLDQYHVAFTDVSSANSGGYVCDFGLSSSTTPGPTNYRSFSTTNAGAGTCAFSRKAGNPHILYTVVSSHIRLYNVATGAFVDSSAAALGYSALWPSTGWPFISMSSGQWFSVNATETWAVANNSGGSPYNAINLTTGAIITWAPSIDDAYMGYTDFMASDVSGQIWSLGTNTQLTISPAIGAVGHGACCRGFWVYYNTNNSSTLNFPAILVSQDSSAASRIGTTSVLPFAAAPTYAGQYHMSGHWWLQTPTTLNASTGGLWMVQSNIGSSPMQASEVFAITFQNPWLGASRRLGFSYSVVPNPATFYWQQPHAHISHDGKLVIFGSTMNGTPTQTIPPSGGTFPNRIDLFLMEVPVTAGTPPSFP